MTGHDESDLNVDRLLANLPRQYRTRDQALVLLADAGLRPTQISVLATKDVTFTGGDGLVGGATLQVALKRQRSRSAVVLDRRAAQALLDVAERPSGRLFADLRAGLPRGIPFQALRHAAATRLANKGLK